MATSSKRSPSSTMISSCSPPPTCAVESKQCGYRGGAGSSAHAPAGTARQLAPRPCREATQCDATGQANPNNSAQ
eukprot:scaffold117274_cov55-Phaeocystis_antarctica.AAC.1